MGLGIRDVEYGHSEYMLYKYSAPAPGHATGDEGSI